MPPRSAAPMYSAYPPRASQYASSMSRGGGGGGGGGSSYYHDMHQGYDRRGPHIPMSMDQQRYDPYRRPDFYDPYMQRGPMPPPHYYNNDLRRHNEAPKGHSYHNDHGSRSSQQTSVRYSNPYNNRR